MARATGVQITDSVVRVIDIEGSVKKPKIRGCAEVGIARGDGEDRIPNLAKALKDAFKQAKAGRDQVVLGIPIRDCIVREITVPFTDPAQIRKVIKFECEAHIHACSIDEVVICFHKVSELGARSTLLVVAAKKEKIREQLQALEKAGIDPLAVDLDAAGLFNILKAQGLTESEKPLVVCDVGYTSTTILVLLGGHLRLVRSMRLGTEFITQRVGRDLDLDPEEARTRTQAILIQDVDLEEDLIVPANAFEDGGEETSKSSAELERDIIRQRQKEFVKRLEQEIYRTLASIDLEESPQKVLLLGPGANLPRIVSELQDKMEPRVERLHLLENMDHRFDSDAARIYETIVPTPAGLAFKQFGHDPLGFDFRQEEFVFANRFDRLKVPIFCLILLMAALNVVWWNFDTKMNAHRESMLEGIAKTAADEFKKVMDENRLGTLVSYVPVEKSELKKLARRAGTDVPPIKRINIMGRTIKELDDQLLDAYGLRKTTKKRSSRKRSSSKNIPQDPSGYRSALILLEWLCRAVADTGVRDFTFNRVNINPHEILFNITLPETVEIEGQKTVGYRKVISMIDANLQKLAGNDFEKLEDQGRHELNEGGRGVDVNLRALFKKQDK